MLVPLKDGKLDVTLNQFFQDLIKKKVVDAMLLPQAILGGKSYAYTLVQDPSQIKNAYPFLTLLMTNGAKAVSSLTAWDPGKKIGVVLRSCEIRTLVELAKFQQADLNHVFLIGVDCLGTVEADEFEKMSAKKSGIKIEDYISELLSGKTDNIRKSCQVCPYPVPPMNVDMNIGFIGADLKKEFYVNTSDEVMAKLGLDKGKDSSKRNETVTKIATGKQKKRDQLLADLKKRYKSIPELLNEFALCKRCYNCRAECPICYCKECVFLTNVFNHKPEEYFRWAERKGSIRLPYDTLLFHLTRLNHMVVSCVECGGCSSACPNGLPVFELFQYVGKDVQAVFDYIPGMNVEDDPPLNTFKEDELEPR